MLAAQLDYRERYRKLTGQDLLQWPALQKGTHGAHHHSRPGFHDSGVGQFMSDRAIYPAVAEYIPAWQVSLQVCADPTLSHIQGWRNSLQNGFSPLTRREPTFTTLIVGPFHLTPDRCRARSRPLLPFKTHSHRYPAAA
jgi:hypothetical protein